MGKYIHHEVDGCHDALEHHDVQDVEYQDGLEHSDVQDCVGNHDGLGRCTTL